MTDRNLVLWDGDCGFCRRCVAWGKRHDVEGRLEWSPYQAYTGPPMTPELAQACSRAVHLVRSSGEIDRGGRAVLLVLGMIGWPRTSRVLLLPPMIWIAELVYRVVAANRHIVGRFLFRNETI